ncbi:MAG: MFS transporter [Acidimicrobiia bacterium]|nr:MFS transporter [Acidimicrobiia bacterium]
MQAGTLAAGEAVLDSRRAWRSVAGGFAAMFAVFGVAYSFGAFFGPMADEFGSGRGATSFVFSITAFLYFTLNMISGPAVDRFGPKPILVFGAVVMGGGLFLTSTVESLLAGYVTYGLGVGVGVACGYVPMVAVIGGWFERRRSAALGIGVAGIGFGTVIGSPMAAALIDAHGWRTAYVILAAVGAGLMLLAAVLTERPPRAVAGDARIGMSDRARTPEFAALYASALLLSLALFQVFVYLPDFAEGIGVGEVPAAALVAVVGGASIAGRLGLGVVADRVGRVRTYRACFLVMGLSYGIWMAAPNYVWLVVFALVMGGSYGGFIALNPAVVAEVFGVAGLGSIMGLLYTGPGFGALLGPPLAGLIIDSAGYRWAIAASMVMAMLAWAALLPLGRTRSPR